MKPSYCVVGMHFVSNGDLVKDGALRNFCFECEPKKINIPNFGFGKDHDYRTKEIFDFLKRADFQNGDYFCFKSGGDGDNGEVLMDLLDAYFKQKDLNRKSFDYVLPYDEDPI